MQHEIMHSMDGRLPMKMPNESFGILEASPGIEPGYKDLQSSASPLRHEASLQFDIHKYRVVAAI
jgi:hypothetical protein